MSLIVAIDPGNIKSAYCVIDTDSLRPLKFDIVENDKLLRMLSNADTEGWEDAVIEMVASYGMPVGREVFDTILWIGRFYQTLDRQFIGAPRLLCRLQEKRHICHDSKAKDANIRRALIDRFAKHDFKSGRGTKGNPDFFYGFKADIWAAYAVGLTAIENHDDDYVFPLEI